MMKISKLLKIWKVLLLGSIFGVFLVPSVVFSAQMNSLDSSDLDEIIMVKGELVSITVHSLSGHCLLRHSLCRDL